MRSAASTRLIAVSGSQLRDSVSKTTMETLSGVCPGVSRNFSFTAPRSSSPPSVIVVPVGDDVAVAFWVALYTATFGLLIWYRVLTPIRVSARHRLRVAKQGFLPLEQVVDVEAGSDRAFLVNLIR